MFCLWYRLKVTPVARVRARTPLTSDGDAPPRVLQCVQAALYAGTSDYVFLAESSSAEAD